MTFRLNLNKMDAEYVFHIAHKTNTLNYLRKYDSAQPRLIREIQTGFGGIGTSCLHKVYTIMIIVV